MLRVLTGIITMLLCIFVLFAPAMQAQETSKSNTDPTCFGRCRQQVPQMPQISMARTEALLAQILAEESKQTEILRSIEVQGRIAAAQADRGVMVPGGNIPVNPWSVPQLGPNIPANPWSVPQLGPSLPAQPPASIGPGTLPQSPPTGNGSATLPALPPLVPPNAVRTVANGKFAAAPINGAKPIQTANGSILYTTRAK